jgi:hypothetical protein
VRHEYGRHAELALDPAQGLAELDADLRVERAERLVEEEQPRLVRERARERHALLLTSGELPRVTAAISREPNQLEQLLAALATVPGRVLRDAKGELDVVCDRHLAEERVVLEDEPDSAILRRDAGDVTPVNEHATVVDLGQSSDHAKKRALAAAARAEQHEELAVRNRESDAIDDFVRRVVALGQVLELDRHGRSVTRYGSPVTRTVERW